MGLVITLIVVIGVIILLVIGFFIGTYNSLVTLRNRVEEAWSDITVQLKRRTDLIQCKRFLLLNIYIALF